MAVAKAAVTRRLIAPICTRTHGFTAAGTESGRRRSDPAAEALTPSEVGRVVVDISQLDGDGGGSR